MDPYHISLLWFLYIGCILYVFSLFRWNIKHSFCSDFKLGADDMINFGTSTYTGDSFGTSGSLQCKCYSNVELKLMLVG